MLVRMTLARIVIVDSEDEKMSMIVLREVDGERAFPILIGIHEAYAIDRRAKRIMVQRWRSMSYPPRGFPNARISS